MTKMGVLGILEFRKLKKTLIFSIFLPLHKMQAQSLIKNQIKVSWGPAAQLWLKKYLNKCLDTIIYLFYFAL